MHDTPIIQQNIWGNIINDFGILVNTYPRLLTQELLADLFNQYNNYLPRINRSKDISGYSISYIFKTIYKISIIEEFKQFISKNEYIHNILSTLLPYIETKETVFNAEDIGNIFFLFASMLEVTELQSIIDNTLRFLKKIFYKTPIDKLKFSTGDFSNLFAAFVKMLNSPKSKQHVIENKYIEQVLSVLSSKIQKNNLIFNGVFFSYIILNIIKISDTPELKQLIIEYKYILQILLSTIVKQRKYLNIKCISITFSTVSRIIKVKEIKDIVNEDTFLDVMLKQISRLFKQEDFNNDFHSICNITNQISCLFDNIRLFEKYHTKVNHTIGRFLRKIIASNAQYPVKFRLGVMTSIKELIRNNILTENKPKPLEVKRFFLNDIIENPTIMKQNKLYFYMDVLCFYQALLTAEDIIKIVNKINFDYTPTDITQQILMLTTYKFFFMKISELLRDKGSSERLLDLRNKFERLINDKIDIFKNTTNTTDNYLNFTMYDAGMLISRHDINISKSEYYLSVRMSSLEGKFYDYFKKYCDQYRYSVYGRIEKQYKINDMTAIDIAFIPHDKNSEKLFIEIDGPNHYIDDKQNLPSRVTYTRNELLKSLVNTRFIIVKSRELLNTEDMLKFMKHRFRDYFESICKIR